MAITQEILQVLRSRRPEIIDSRSYEEIRDDRVARYKHIHPEWDGDTLVDDPIRSAIDAFSLGEFITRTDFNEKFLQNLLPFATGASLELIGARVGLTLREDEPEDTFRLRIARAPADTLSVGTLVSLSANAFAADARVIDAQPVIAPNGQDATVFIRSSEEPSGSDVPGTPSEELVDIVTDYISQPGRVHLTDTYVASAPRFVGYTVSVNLRYYDGNLEPSLAIQSVRNNLYRYVAFTYAIGSSLRLDGIRAACLVSGVEFVEVIAPLADVSRADGVALYCPLNETSVSVSTEVLSG